VTLLVTSRLAPWFVDAATVFGVAGTFATLCGLYVTYRQARESRRAADAARDAAYTMDVENKRRFARFVLQQARGMAKEARVYCDSRNYQLAAVKVRDLAETVAQIGTTFDHYLPRWKEFADELRAWDDTFLRAAKEPGKFSRTSERKWLDFQREFHSELDAVAGPFVVPDSGGTRK